jgi:hypothetical protein
MPDLLVLVSNVVVIGGTPKIVFVSTTSDGFEAGGEVDADFAQSSPQTNTAVVDGAKAAQSSLNGVVFDPADRVMLFAARAAN